MLLFDFSDIGFRVLRLSPKILGGEVLSSYTEAPIKEGLISQRKVSNPEELAKEIKPALEKAGVKVSGEEAALSLHDDRVFSLRLKVSAGKGVDVLEAIGEEVETFIPEPISSQAVSFRPVGEGKGGDFSFVAVNKDLLVGYLDLFKALGLKLSLAVPESYAIYAVLTPSIAEGETAVYLNVEENLSDAVVMDGLGVLQTFTGEIETAKIENRLGEIMEFMEKRWARKITKIFVGGKSVLDQKKLAESLKVEVLGAEKVLEKYPFEFGSGTEKMKKVEAVNLLGLAALTRQKDALNLAPKD